jgi:hypothetical protein
MTLSVAYAGGLVDGEGCLQIIPSGTSKKGYASRVDVGMKKPAVSLLKAFSAQWGGTVTMTRRATTKWEEAWRWGIQGSEADLFVATISPYLHIKARQAALLMALADLRSRLEHTPTGKVIWTDEARQRALSLRMMVQEANRKGPEQMPAPSTSSTPFARLVGGTWMKMQDGMFPHLCSDTFSETWPKRGTTRNGRAYERPRSALRTVGNESSFTPGLLPTPSTSMPNDGEDPATWQARANRLKQKHGNGNGVGMPLAIAVQLLPTPRTTDSTGPGEHGNGGLDLSTAVNLLPTPTSRDHKGRNQRDDTTCLPGAIGDLTKPPSNDGSRSSDAKHPTQPTTGDDSTPPLWNG